MVFVSGSSVVTRSMVISTISFAITFFSRPRNPAAAVYQDTHPHLRQSFRVVGALLVIVLVIVLVVVLELRGPPTLPAHFVAHGKKKTEVSYGKLSREKNFVGNFVGNFID